MQVETYHCTRVTLFKEQSVVLQSPLYRTSAVDSWHQKHSPTPNKVYLYFGDLPLIARQAHARQTRFPPYDTFTVVRGYPKVMFFCACWMKQAAPSRNVLVALAG